jgi:hypothetical protein
MDAIEDICHFLGVVLVVESVLQFLHKGETHNHCTKARDEWKIHEVSLRLPITFEVSSIAFQTLGKAFIWANEANTGVGAAGVTYRFESGKKPNTTNGILQCINRTFRKGEAKFTEGLVCEAILNLKGIGSK